MLTVEIGTVKWFNGSTGVKYGFLTDASGHEIFFHYNDGRPIIVSATTRQPEFSEEAKVKTKDGLHGLREPAAGEQLVFLRAPGRKGDKASPWGFKSNYDRAVEKAASLPEPTTYRVWESRGDVGEAPSSTKVLWEGSDRDELLAKYPVPSGKQSASSDPLLPYWSDSDAIFEIRHWFERKVDEKWVSCLDPRPLSGVNRQFERISRR